MKVKSVIPRELRIFFIRTRENTRKLLKNEEKRSKLPLFFKKQPVKNKFDLF